MRRGPVRPRAGRGLQPPPPRRHPGLKGSIDDGGSAGRTTPRLSWLRAPGIPALGSWFTNRGLAGGGPLADIGVHVLDYALHLFGEPKVIAVSAVDALGAGPPRPGRQRPLHASEVGSAKFEVEDFATWLLIGWRAAARSILEAGWAAYRADGRPDGLHALRHRRRRGTPRRRRLTRPSAADRIFTGEGRRERRRSWWSPTPGRGAPAVVEDLPRAVRGGEWSHWDGSLALTVRAYRRRLRVARLGAEVRLTRTATSTTNHAPVEQRQ